MRYFQVTCRLDLERQVGSDQRDSTEYHPIQPLLPFVNGANP